MARTSSRNQSTYSRSLRSTAFSVFLLGLVVHHPRPPRFTGLQVSPLSDRECKSVRLDESLREYVTSQVSWFRSSDQSRRDSLIFDRGESKRGKFSSGVADGRLRLDSRQFIR